MKNQDGIKVKLKKKVHRRIFERSVTFWLHALLSISVFVAFFTTPLPKWRNCWMASIKVHNVAMDGILCEVKNMKIFCNFILAGRHLSEFDITLDFFRFSCSGYDVTLIIKSHTLNCYSFSLKFLLKIKTYNFVVGN